MLWRSLSKWPILVIALPILQACKEESHETADFTSPLVSTVIASERSLTTTVTAAGAVTPRRQAMVHAQMPGLVLTEIIVDEGRMVEAGDIMARMTSERQQAELAGARGELERAGRALARASALRESSAISESAFDSAMADHALAQARVRGLEIDLEQSIIRAPVAGLVLRRMARLGERIDGGALFEIAAGAELEVVADLSEEAWKMITPGQSCTIRLAGGRVLTGQVRLLSGALDEQTRMGRVWISVQNAGAGLVAGTGATVSLEMTHGTPLTIPGASLLFDHQGPHVFVVSGGRAIRRNVTLGAQNGQITEVLTGLAPGDLVVARAGSLLRDGDPVGISPPLDTTDSKS